MPKKSPVKSAPTAFPSTRSGKTPGGARSMPMETKTAPPSPTRDEIARRAYELYLARGKSSGHETEDWVQAERELAARVQRRN